MLCKTCNKHRHVGHFSKHAGCSSGYDTSRCKPCKKARADWAKVPLEKRIYNRAKTRAKRKGIPFDILLEDVVIPNKCPVFSQPFVYGDPDWTYSIDRLDNSKGYVRGNILIVSNKANRLKNDATMDDLRTVVDFYEHLERESNDGN